MKTLLSTLLLLWPLLSVTAQTTCTGSIEINSASSTLSGTGEALNWYVFSPSQDGRLVLSRIDPSGNGQGIEVYSGCLLGSPTGRLTPQNECDCCSRDGLEKKEYPLESGTDAYIAVPFQSSYQFTWIPTGSVELLRCGELYSRSTLGQENNYNTYPCLIGGTYYNYNGPDAIFKVEKPVVPGYLNVSLFADGAPLDVFVFEEVSGGIRCIARGIQDNDPSGTSFDFFIDRPPPRQAGNYYIIVDSPSQGSDFRISVTCEPLNCGDTQTLECGRILTRETNCGGANRAMAYRTATGSPEFMGYNAPEKKYSFTLDNTTDVSITLSNIDPGEKLDLFLLNACNEYNLIAAGAQVFKGGSETIQTRLSAGTYYVVVDGFDGSVSEFDLSLSYDNCISLPDICDLAGTNIDLGNTFSRTLDDFDRNPVFLQQFDCVQSAFGDKNIGVLYADLYTYFHAEDGVFRLQFIHEGLDTSRIKAFAFRCDCPEESGCRARCEERFIEVEEVNTKGKFVYENAPAGFYYLLVVSLDTGPYTFKMTPGGPCTNDDVTGLSCGDMLKNQQLDQSFENNFNSTGEGAGGKAYDNSYNGSRSYQGPDRVYELFVTDYKVVDITLQTDQPMGMFLFNNLCGRNNLNFAEIIEGENTARIEAARLEPGVNYLIIDHDSSEGGGTFDLSIRCSADPTPLLLTSTSSRLSCPTLSDSIHTFAVIDLQNAQVDNQPVLPGDQLFFRYIDENGNLISGADRPWNLGGITVPLEADNTTVDTIKCGWEEGDLINFRYRRAERGVQAASFYEVEAAFVEGVPNDNNIFRINGQSIMNNIRRLDLSTLNVTPVSYNLSNRTTTVAIRVVTNETWIVEEQPEVPWLEFSTTPTSPVTGSGVIEVRAEENNTNQIRETTLLIRTTSSTAREISFQQLPACTPPRVEAGPDQTVSCAAPEVQLQGSFSGIPNSAEVEWRSEGAGQIVRDQNTLTPTVRGPGTYQLTVTDQVTGCVSSDQVTVTGDIELPMAEAGPDQILNCNNPSVRLDGAQSDAGINFVYQWSTTDGNILMDGDRPTPLVDAPGTYELRVTNTENGCTSTDEVQVIRRSPVAALVTEQRDASCQDASDGFAALEASGGLGPYNYFWSNGRSGPVQDNLPADVYSVTITDEEGCQVIQTVTIGVNDVIKPTIITRNIMVFLNENGEAVISAADIDDGSADNCRIGSRLLDKDRFSCADVGNNTITLTVTDVNQNTASKTALVMVMDTLAPAISCPPDIQTSSCAVIYDLPQVDDNCVALAPNLIEGFPSGAVFPAGITTVTYTAMDESGNQRSCSFVVEVLPAPDPIAVKVDTVSNASAEQADGFIEILVSGGQPPYTFLWLSEGDTISVEQNPSGLAPGFYEVEVTDESGCLAVFGPFVVESSRSTSVNDPQLLSRVKLFPNPTQGKIYMNLNLDRNHPITVKIYDYLGREVLRHRKEKVRNQSYEWNLSDHANGLYLVKMQVGKDLLIWKILLTN